MKLILFRFNDFIQSAKTLSNKEILLLRDLRTHSFDGFRRSWSSIHLFQACSAAFLFSNMIVPFLLVIPLRPRIRSSVTFLKNRTLLRIDVISRRRCHEEYHQDRCVSLRMEQIEFFTKIVAFLGFTFQRYHQTIVKYIQIQVLFSFTFLFAPTMVESWYLQHWRFKLDRS